MPQDQDNKTKVKKFADAASKVGRNLAEPSGDVAKELFEAQKMNEQNRRALGIPEDEGDQSGMGSSAPAKPIKPSANPSTQYGTRPGEKRFSNDELKEMTKPLGSSSKQGLGSIPLYDQGGDVKSPVAKPNVNDGNHQVAVLESGEKVLTPREAADYDAEHPESVHPPLMSVPSDDVMKNAPKFPSGNEVMPELHASARDYIDRPATLAGIEKLYNQAGPDLFMKNQFSRPSERLVPMDPAGNLTLGNETKGEAKHDDNGGQSVTARIPRNSLGFIHTHNAGMDTGPSKYDVDAAHEADMPNYEVSANEIDVVMPNGHRGKVADIKREKGEA